MILSLYASVYPTKDNVHMKELKNPNPVDGEDFKIECVVGKCGSLAGKYLHLFLQNWLICDSFIHIFVITDRIRPQDPTIYFKFHEESLTFQGNYMMSLSEKWNEHLLSLDAVATVMSISEEK